MVKEKAESKDIKVNLCTNVFKNEILKREDYTRAWIELISRFEEIKSCKKR